MNATQTIKEPTYIAIIGTIIILFVVAILGIIFDQPIPQPQTEHNYGIECYNMTYKEPHPTHTIEYSKILTQTQLIKKLNLMVTTNRTLKNANFTITNNTCNTPTTTTQ